VRCGQISSGDQSDVFQNGRHGASRSRGCQKRGSIPQNRPQASGFTRFSSSNCRLALFLCAADRFRVVIEVTFFRTAGSARTIHVPARSGPGGIANTRLALDRLRASTESRLFQNPASPRTGPAGSRSVWMQLRGYRRNGDSRVRVQVVRAGKRGPASPARIHL